VNRSVRRHVDARQAAILLASKNDDLLDILNAVLLAYGEGPDRRLAVAREYTIGQLRRQIGVKGLPGGGFVIHLETAGLPIAARPTPWQRLIAWITARLRRPAPVAQEDTDAEDRLP